jgi:signal transduction histidine kinase
MKFTATSTIRRITVRYDISLRPPSEDTCAVPDDTHESTGKIAEDTPVWLFVSVQDTGPGLGVREQEALFKRFSRMLS